MKKMAARQDNSVHDEEGIPKSIDTMKSTDVDSVVSGSSKWRFQVVDTTTKGDETNKDSRKDAYSAPVAAFQQKELPAPTDFHYSAPVLGFQQTFSMDSDAKPPTSGKSPTKASRMLARMVGLMKTTANCTETCVPLDSCNENESAYIDMQAGSLVSVNTQDLGSLVSIEETVSKTNASNKPRDEGTHDKASSKHGGSKWKFRLVKKKTKPNDIVEPYLSDSSQDDSLLKGVELVTSLQPVYLLHGETIRISICQLGFNESH